MPTPQIYESEYSNKYLNTAQNLQRPLKKKKIYDQPVTHSSIQTLVKQLLGARCCLNTGDIETNTTGPLFASSI